MLTGRILRIFLSIVVSFILSGCVTSSSHLKEISLGMSKQEVTSVLGDPAVARGAVRNKYGQVVEVWEYTLALPSKDSPGEIAGKTVMTVFSLGIFAGEFKGERKNYWLYFVNNELVQWGEAGDWKKEPERIYDFQFNTQPRLAR